MNPTGYTRGDWVWLAGYGLLGMLGLCLLSGLQKMAIDVPPFNPMGYVIPAVFGTVAGGVVGCLLLRARRLSRSLEHQVNQRTHELEAANQELQSFAYSVSHDLRAPLRSLKGFTDILQQDEYRAHLDERGQDYLGRIHAAAERMDTIILEYLGLTQISSVDLNLERVDLSGLAREVADGLQRSQPDRQVEVEVADRLVVQADAGLARRLLEILLDNAFKFTAPRQAGRVELFTERIAGQPTIVVRDNGIGFDMRYADKLFVPLQRLVGRRDFPGVGMGLAVARRIVNRHQGRLWAEAEPDQGARFFFRL